MITPDRLLMLIAAEASRDGLVCPQLDTLQARHAAERLLATVGLARPTPPPALTPPPAPALPRRVPMDAPTRPLPVIRRYHGRSSSAG